MNTKAIAALVACANSHGHVATAADYTNAVELFDRFVFSYRNNEGAFEVASFGKESGDFSASELVGGLTYQQAEQVLKLLARTHDAVRNVAQAARNYLRENETIDALCEIEHLAK